MPAKGISGISVNENIERNNKKRKYYTKLKISQLFVENI